jgi:hypothetical protein
VTILFEVPLHEVFHPAKGFSGLLTAGTDLDPVALPRAERHQGQHTVCVRGVLAQADADVGIEAGDAPD